MSSTFLYRCARQVDDCLDLHGILLALAQAGVTWLGCALVVSLVGLLTG